MDLRETVFEVAESMGLPGGDDLPALCGFVNEVAERAGLAYRLRCCSEDGEEAAEMLADLEGYRVIVHDSVEGDLDTSSEEALAESLDILGQDADRCLRQLGGGVR